MKICLLHYAAPPVVGGVESVIRHHARLMAADGHRVRIIAGRGEQVDPGTEFVQFPLVDSRHPGVLAVKEELDQGRVPTAFNEITDRIESELERLTRGFDWIIAHNVCSLNKNLPLTAALRRLTRADSLPRVMLWHHDLAWTTPRYQAELHDGFPWDLLRQNWPEATQVTISAERQRELSDLFGIELEQVHVVPNGLDVSRFLKLEELTYALVKEYNLLSASPLLLLPVRITRRKNIEMGLRMLAHLQEDFPQAALVVTGPPGPHNPANQAYFDELVSLRKELGLQNAVHFLAEARQRYLPDPVIADMYRLADGLFLPSREEGFGLPVLEAGISGLPVFCADIPQLRELAMTEAYYFQPDIEPQEAAQLLSRHFTQSAEFKLASRVRSQYTWERIYQRFILPLLNHQ